MLIAGRGVTFLSAVVDLGGQLLTGVVCWFFLVFWLLLFTADERRERWERLEELRAEQREILSRPAATPAALRERVGALEMEGEIQRAEKMARAAEAAVGRNLTIRRRGKALLAVIAVAWALIAWGVDVRRALRPAPARGARAGLS